jgi:hypothetical protein
MNNIEFLEAIEQIKNNLDNENFAREFCSTYEIENMSTYNILKQCAMSGKKHIDAVARAVEQEGDIEIDKIVQFSKFTEKFLQKNGFISPLLITSYPEDKIDDFNKEKWGSVTKVAL